MPSEDGKSRLRFGKDTDQSVVWMKPYFDENSKSAVLTTTAPFYHFNGDFRDVVMANIDLKNLQKMITSIEVGKSGRAFLVDSEGTYNADRDEQKLLKMKLSQDLNASLANVGQTMLKKEGGYATYEDTNGLNGQCVRRCGRANGIDAGNDSRTPYACITI